MFLTVSDIQHFSVGDGDGIRTTVFLKGCNLCCPWCHNPETISKLPQTLIYSSTGKAIEYGKKMSVEEIMVEVLADKVFYENSDGGLTVSGGEAMLQIEALTELLKTAKGNNINTLVDTAGNVPFDSFEKINNFVDTYYFDLKCACAEDYKKIGGDFDRIVNNIKNLIVSGADLHIRIPLIPGFNTSDDYVEKMCTVIKSTGAENVDLLPFHRLGSSKYTAIGLDYKYKDIEPMTKEQIAHIEEIYKKSFITKIEK